MERIRRKGVVIRVLRVRVRELDKTKCSFKFLQKNISEDDEVFVKCDENGNLLLQGSHYSIFKIEE